MSAALSVKPLSAAGGVFGAIAALAMSAGQLVPQIDAGDHAPLLDAIEALVSQIGVLADAGAAACGEVTLLGSVEDWCFSPHASKCLAELKALKAEGMSHTLGVPQAEACDCASASAMKHAYDRDVSAAKGGAA